MSVLSMDKIVAEAPTFISESLFLLLLFSVCILNQTCNLNAASTTNLPLICQYVLRFLEMVKQDSSRVIQFHYQTRSFTFNHRLKLKSFLKHIFKKERKTLNSLIFVFCTDDYVLDMNNRFLSHDFFTDILTFDLSDSPKQVIAEIYISIDRVRENALYFKTSFRLELHRVVFHGVLHLCGYTDKTKEEKIQIKKKEEYYLRKHANWQSSTWNNNR
ncbi:MAG: rRNA maturation RNase YbeY [Chitinophagaceae bacterium]